MLIKFIELRTAHRLKGLEADQVIVLGKNLGAYGFQSQMEDDPLLALVMPVKEDFRYAEERRLFYVALIRAWHTVTLLTRKDRVSNFVHEFLAPAVRWKVRYGEAAHAPARVCPSCKEGCFGKRRAALGCSWGV